MKKLLFVLCMIGAFGISSIAQPVNNVIRWMRGGDPNDMIPNYFPYFNDFLGGYDLSLLTYGEHTSYFSVDLSTTPIGNLFVNITYDINSAYRSDHKGGTGSLYADWENNTINERGLIPTQYTESANDNNTIGHGSFTMTNDCIPTSNDYFVEVYMCAEIEWDNGGYTDLQVMYDFTLDGTPFLPAS